MEQITNHPSNNDQVSVRLRGSAELSRQLRRAEDAIRRRAFGVRAEVVLRSGYDEEGEGDWQESLCFGQLDGQWQLYLQSGFVDRPESLRQADLFASTLETRLLAAKKIPVLVQALEASEADRREDALAAARALSSFTDRLLRSDS